MAQIRRGDPEVPLGYRRIETSALAQAGPVDAKRFLDSLGDRLRDRGRDHPVAGTHEQGVVEMVAQRLKIAAQRRLRKLKLVGREEIGRAHVCTPVTNAHLVCRLLLEK